MKLHKVCLNNLNSFYGEHLIDFEKDLCNAPLFLISGPTGSGKSTVLDAICLALFGQTPRLSASRGKPETDARLIMSHGTSSCAAEVEFSRLFPDGSRKRYRAAWTCRRSRGHADGRLQDAERSLTLIQDGGIEELLISDKRAKYFLPVFNKHLEQISVEDFKRSVLLAQGEFAAFLRADEKEKASILERLTNTDEYKNIGQRAAARCKNAKKDLDVIEQKLENLHILEESEAKQLYDSFAELETEADCQRQTLSDAQKRLKWLEALASYKETLRQAEERKAQKAEDSAAHADTIVRLEEDERCQPAEPLLRTCQETEKELKSVQSETTRLLKEEEETAKKVATLTAANEEAEALLGEAKTEKEDAQPLLDEAQILEGSLAQNRLDLAQSTEAQIKAEEEKKKSEKELARNQTKHKQLLSSQNENQRALEAIAYAKELSSEYAGLASQTERMGDLQEHLQEAEDECLALTKKKASLQKKLQTLSKKAEDAKATLLPFSERLEKAEATRSELLGGAPDLRSCREKLDLQRIEQQEQIHRIDEATRMHKELVELVDGLQQAEQEKDALEWDLQSLRPRIELKRREELQIEDLSDGQANLLRMIERMLALSDKRKELLEEEECPLCGSTEHPYLADDGMDASEAKFLNDREEVQNSIKETKKERKEIQKVLKELDREVTQKESKLKQQLTQMDTLTKTMSKRHISYTEMLGMIGIGAADEFPSEKEGQEEHFHLIGEKRYSFSVLFDDLSGQIKVIDDLRDEIELAHLALEKASKESDELNQKCLQLKQLVTLREEELVDKELRHKTHLDKWKEEASGLREQFASFSIKLPEMPSKEQFEHALEDALQKKLEYEQIHEKLDHFEEQVKECSHVVEQVQHSLKAALVQLKERTEEVNAKEKKQEEIKQTQQALLGDETLSKMKRRLDKATEQAEAKSVSARAALAGIRERHSRLLALCEEKKRFIAEREDILNSTKADLLLKLEELGLSSAELLEQKLLPLIERKTLQGLVKEARLALENSAFQLESAKTALVEHESNCPEIEDLTKRSQEEWQSHVEELRTLMNEKHEEIGVLREKIKQHENATSQAFEWTEALSAARETFRVWETINKIIGVGDGDSFKQFAQSLNLQELVDRANIRLLRLNPRYTLAVATGENGEPKLNFVIRDHHHAEHERPLTTLSGGETFLVSLALALALADFRRIDMPIETLLLDEGFGTLDQETLDVAMSTLRQLQQESDQQIGLISHVEMLKDRIDTRIIVEKIGNGRSSLSVEGIPSNPIIPVMGTGSATSKS